MTGSLPIARCAARDAAICLRRSSAGVSPRNCWPGLGVAQIRGDPMGVMRRAIAREEKEWAKAMEEQKRMNDRFASTLVIAASIIAAVRLARDQEISRPSPRLASVVTESIGLARMILEKIVR